MKTLIAAALAASAFLTAVPAAAVVVSGDFLSQSDLPSYSSYGPKTYQNLGAVLGTGLELNGSHFVSNPAGWGGGVVFADWDAGSNILTLFSQDTWDFQTYDFSVSNIVFDNAQVITGLSHIGGSLTNGGLVPTLGFTDNSVSIKYSPELFNFTGQSAQFQVVLSDVAGGVPEPTTWAMLIIGFGAVGVAARRSRRGIVQTAA